MKPITGKYETYRDVFQGKRMPLAFVDMDNLRENLRVVKELIRGSGKTIRIHTKSLRSPEIIEIILREGGEDFRGLMTFSMEETDFLAQRGLDDFIVAYPTCQPSDLKLFADLSRRGVTVRLMIDSAEHVRLLQKAGEEAQATLHVCLELDCAYRPLPGTHLGLRRSPVRRPEDTEKLVAALEASPRVALDAVMGYEGHIAGPNDAVPGRVLNNAAIRFLKSRSIRDFTPRRDRLVKDLRERGFALPVVNGGGSGSIVSTLRDPVVTEITAGSAFYAPGLFWHYREVSYTPAAFFALQVVRIPAPGMVTCQGGGYPASGPAGADKLPVPVYPEGMKYLPLEGAGEVQTPLEMPKTAPSMGLGDPIFFQHAKAGELAERFNEFYCIGKDPGGAYSIVQKVRTYRGEGKAFI